MKTFIVLILILVVIIGIGIFTRNDNVEAPAVVPEEEMDEYSEEKAALAAKSNIIRVDNLVPGQSVTSSITVTGEARGPWYFEASFPLEVQLPTGEMLVQGFATAQGEWMTENFVSFTGTIVVPADKLTSGEIVLILRKDNPSGLPEHDDSIRIPLLLVK